MKKIRNKKHHVQSLISHLFIADMLLKICLTFEKPTWSGHEEGHI